MDRSGDASGHPGVLVMSSSARIIRCLHALLTSSCHVVCHFSTRDTLGTAERRRPDLVLDSIIVPKVDNCSLYGRVGRSVRLYRVPIVLMATGAAARGRIRNLGDKTSTCIAGPFAPGILLTVVGSRLAGHRGTGAVLAGTARASGGIRRMLSPRSGLFVSRLCRVVRRRLTGSRLSIGGMAGLVRVSHAGLCCGIGKLAKRGPDIFFGACGLGHTTALVIRNGCGVSRVTCVAKFGALSRFSADFGGRFKYAPDRCDGGACWVSVQGESILKGGTCLYVRVSLVVGGKGWL